MPHIVFSQFSAMILVDKTRLPKAYIVGGYMAVRITDLNKGTPRGITYSDKDVARMAKATAPIKGSVFRRPTGLKKIAALQGKRATKGNLGKITAAIKAGKGGFSVMGGGRRRGAAGGRTK